MIKGFRDFLLRGNVVDLAVAVIIGAAFGAVVADFSKGIISGLIGAVGGSPDFGGASFRLNGSPVIYGPFLTSVINFLIVAAAVYFLVVVPMNALLIRRKTGAEPEVVATPEDVALLQEIRDLLRDRPMS